MPTVTWDGDGQPRSPLYQDIYRSQGPDGDHGLQQARQVFLEGCQLMGSDAVWRGHPHWCVLENGFGLGLNFLATWQSWRSDPQRPRRLHYIATEAHPVQPQDLLRSSLPWPELGELTQHLTDAWWGLLPGVHRMSFDQGAVVLDLVVGDSRMTLPQLEAQAHSVYLDGFSPRRNPEMWQPDILRQLKRLSRPGARWATWSVAGQLTRQLTDMGLEVIKRPGLPPKRASLTATCPLDSHTMAPTVPSTHEPIWVLGAGLAGASTARALAELGHHVRVLDAQGPAAGASGLPAGLFAIHTSGDDNTLSRLTRMGLRHTRGRLSALEPGQDWAPSGLDEHLLGAKAKRQLPTDLALAHGWTEHVDALDRAKLDWWQPMTGGWHQPKAGWLKPGQLVRHLLDHPAIETAWGWSMQKLQKRPQGWELGDGQGRLITGAQNVIVAMGPASTPLLGTCGVTLALQPVRGQVTWGMVPDPRPESWPLRPRNGDGSLLPTVPYQEQERWLVGSSFDRSSDQALINLQDQTLNAQRWQRLAPDSAHFLPPLSNWQAWAGVRATVRDRLPRVGPVPGQTGLWVFAGLGARGLTLSTLCGEQLAAWITGTSSPLPRCLASPIHQARD